MTTAHSFRATLCRSNCYFYTLLFLLTLAKLSPASAAEPFLEQTNLFLAGDKGVSLYRIPGMAVTTNGTILVYCEARLNSHSDWADSEIWLRRSTDSGKSFEAPRKIAHLAPRLEPSPIAIAHHQKSTNDQTVNNPVAIVDRQTGVVHFLYCVNYERCFYMRSDDDGQTFSKPVDITGIFDQFRPEYDCHIIATGPGHGIQLVNGRLVVPVWLNTGPKNHRPSVAATIYSDDHGATWHRGNIALPSSPDWPSPNETELVELADGRVMLNSRTGDRQNRRVVATSPDGATHWTEAHLDQALLEPVCMASIARFSTSPPADKNRLLFSNPNNLDGGKFGDKPGEHRLRKNVSVKLSYDEGQTWPVNKTLEPGTSAYSDLAVLPDGTILCFYERAQMLALARFNLDWLTDRKDSFKR